MVKVASTGTLIFYWSLVVLGVIMIGHEYHHHHDADDVGLREGEQGDGVRVAELL